MKVLVIIPAYNEELNIKKVVSNLIDHYPQYNYVVVNDGSADSTSQICHQEGYNIIDLPVNLGLAGAFQTGLKYADQEGYDCAIQFDADGQHRPEYIEDLLKEIENGYDIVIGSRFVTEKKTILDANVRKSYDRKSNQIFNREGTDRSYFRNAYVQ